jgi:hypothetical protein
VAFQAEACSFMLPSVPEAFAKMRHMLTFAGLSESLYGIEKEGAGRTLEDGRRRQFFLDELALRRVVHLVYAL